MKEENVHVLLTRMKRRRKKKKELLLPREIYCSGILQCIDFIGRKRAKCVRLCECMTHHFVRGPTLGKLTIKIRDTTRKKYT